MEKQSAHIFSFPETPSSDPKEFEFGCIKAVDFPADHLFQNGRLLPHSFPVVNKSRKSTATCSKDSLSLISSSSNSANSSRSGTTSSCNSARTSASDASSAERNAFQKRLYRNYVSADATQRWQFITPAPVLDSRRRRLSAVKKKKMNVGGEGLGLGFCKRVLRSFVKSCRACHAMEGAVLEGDAFGSHLEYLK